jgi:hypothetical protein
MIGKISDPRGTHVQGLIYYLFGLGRREEHTDPHLIAGWRHPAELEPPLLPNGSRDFRRLNGLLQQPHAVLGARGFARPVWHCAVRAAPEDRMLSDDEWAQIADDIMHRTGLAPRGQDDDAVRWVAVRHGDDHIHIVAMLARQDGGKPCLPNERYRVREACRAAEERYGLRRTASGDRTAARRPTRAEHEKAQRHNRPEPPRVTLRRAVSTAAAGASSEEQFFSRLNDAGIMIRKRFSTRNPGQITGYAVALPDDLSPSGSPVWFSGGKLAPDLTLPKLQHRWRPGAVAPSAEFTRTERNSIWAHAIRSAADATAQIRFYSTTDPNAAADAAWAAADTLHVAASALRSRTLRRAADSFDRAARAPHRRLPRPAPAGDNLRQAARLLAIAGFTRDDPSLSYMRLISQLVGLAAAVADLRTAQHHAAQAAAARQAAEHLHALRVGSVPRTASQRPRTRTAARMANLDFPLPLGMPPRPAPPPPGEVNYPARRPPRAPRPRGPTM